MTTKLSLYNGALRLLKERRLASLTENRESRRLLDDAWGDGASGGAVRHCLELGQWTFATRTVQADASPSVEPDFGYPYAFDQPSDMVDVCGMFSDSDCLVPLTQYVDERHYWYAALPTIWVKYVSNSNTYGGDMTLWPESFIKMVEAYLALEVAPTLTNGDTLIKMAERALALAKREARSGDAMRKPTTFMPSGSWTNARARGGRYDRSLWNGRSR